MALCLETLLAGHSALVFCATKAQTEKLASSLAAEFRKLGKPREKNVFECEESRSVRAGLQAQLNGNLLSDVIP